MRCSCELSPFKHERFGHIITGDLDIIQNRTLREVCTFGTKFRENPTLNLNNICKQVRLDIDKLVIKIVNKFKLPKNALRNWKTYLFNNFRTKLNSCKASKTYRAPILSNISCKQNLTD